MIRRIPRLALLLTFLSAVPTLAFADDNATPAAKPPTIGQEEALEKVITEATLRDRNYSVDVLDEAKVRKGGRWVPVERVSLFGPNDLASDRIGSAFFADPQHKGMKSAADGAKLGRGVHAVDYGTSGWRTASRWSTKPINTRRQADLNEVVADLPVGTEIQVHLGREKVDGVKFLMAVQRGTAAAQERGYIKDSDADLGLAPADPKLPTLVVTRQDPSVPAGEARLRQIQTKDRGPTEFYKRHARTMSLTHAKVRISPVRKH